MDSSWSTNIKDALVNENDPKKFYRILEIIFVLEIYGVSNRYGESSHDKNFYYNKVDEAINLSNINVSITKKNGEVIFYPSGEKNLDKQLVNKTFSFLTDKPEQHFIDALKYFDENNAQARIKSINSLRRSLEEFFRLLLKNEKGLKENIAKIGSALQDKNANNDIRNLITSIISRLDHPIFNNNSKHKDGSINESENEFMIYQVALLMRYLHRTINN